MISLDLKKQLFLQFDPSGFVSWAKRSFPVHKWPCKPYASQMNGALIGHHTRYYNGERVTLDTPAITEEQALQAVYAYTGAGMHFLQDMFIVRKIVTNLPQFNYVRTNALLKIAYLVGFKGLLTFKKLRKAVHARDWGVAGDEIWDSKLAARSPKLVREIAIEMHTGIGQGDVFHDLLYRDDPYKSGDEE